MAWRLLSYKKYDASTNMAIDEAILTETIKNKQEPTLRFYGWHPAAVSIGYFQDVQQEVNIEKCRAAGIDIVRRLTGGKAVLHSAEVTYALIARDDEFFPLDILGTYKIVSNCLVEGLTRLGIKAYLTADGRALNEKQFKACCFSAPSQYELLVAGRKICGSAQVRRKGGFLQHGSLLVDFDALASTSLMLPPRTPEQVLHIENSVTAINKLVNNPLQPEEICPIMKNGFTSVLGIAINEMSLTAAEEHLKNKLINKYHSISWTMYAKE